MHGLKHSIPTLLCLSAVSWELAFLGRCLVPLHIYVDRTTDKSHLLVFKSAEYPRTTNELDTLVGRAYSTASHARLDRY